MREAGFEPAHPEIRELKSRGIDQLTDSRNTVLLSSQTFRSGSFISFRFGSFRFGSFYFVSLHEMSNENTPKDIYLYVVSLSSFSTFMRTSPEVRPKSNTSGEYR